MPSEGTVREWSDDHGWGVLDSPDTYRADLVWPPGAETGTPPRAPDQHGPSAAYQSSLTIRWADGTVTHGLPDQAQDS